MIEINLLPEESKPKAKKVKIESKSVLNFIPLVFSILIFLHIFLAIVSIIQNCRLSALNNKWHNLEPQRKILEETKKELNILSADSKAIQQLTGQRISWAEKLNSLSINLPSGIWFNEILLSNKEFSLKGSIISLQKEEMGLIDKFLSNLKSDAGFFKDFNNLELGSVQKKVIGGYEVSDFILTGKLK